MKIQTVRLINVTINVLINFMRQQQKIRRTHVICYSPSLAIP